jgi:anti-sigma-K factor RskA
MSTSPRDHDRWTDSLGAWLLGALPEDEAAGFERHLGECAACREDAAALQVAVDALPASAEPHAPPPALKARIMAEVEREAALLHAAGPESDRPARRSRFAWLTPRPALAWGLAVLLLLVGAGAGVLGSNALRGTDRISAQVSGGGRATLEVVGGHGRLVASRLPAPPSGRVYQVWLDKGGPAPEPTNALFSTSRDGSASVDVPSLDGVRRVMVTDEPSGGSRRPTGKVLLTART